MACLISIALLEPRKEDKSRSFQPPERTHRAQSPQNVQVNLLQVFKAAPVDTDIKVVLLPHTHTIPLFTGKKTRKLTWYFGPAVWINSLSLSLALSLAQRDTVYYHLSAFCFNSRLQPREAGPGGRRLSCCVSARWTAWLQSCSKRGARSRQESPPEAQGVHIVACPYLSRTF